MVEAAPLRGAGLLNTPAPSLNGRGPPSLLAAAPLNGGALSRMGGEAEEAATVRRRGPPALVHARPSPCMA